MSDAIYAAESAPSATAGLRLGDSLTNVGKDLWATVSEDDFSGTALAIDGVVAGLDLLAFALNPFKEFLMAGIGWIIEHVDWLREPLEMLTGDPAAITAVSQTWSNISQAFDNAGTDMAGLVEQLSEWQGEAAEAYRDTTTSFSELLSGTAGAAQSVSNYYAAIGIVVATIKAIVMELICEFVSRGIIILLGALASAAFTFGGSIGVGIAMTITSAIETSAKIGMKVTKALAKVGELLGKVGKLRNSSGRSVRRPSTRSRASWGTSASRSAISMTWSPASPRISCPTSTSFLLAAGTPPVACTTTWSRRSTALTV
jgi:uncharacterized protein YukE